MKRFFAILIMLLLCAAPTLANSYRLMTLPELTVQSDVIARVRVLSTRPNPRRSNCVLDQLATVEVVESLYGTKAGTRIVVDFDTGSYERNVLYVRGEERIVFLGRYGNVHATMDYDNGKRHWRSPAQYQIIRKTINAELAKLAMPTYRGLRGAKLRAWEDLQWRLHSARGDLRDRIENTYRNNTGKKFPLPLDWISRY